MLVAALTMICGNIFAQEETTVTWEASSGDDLTTIYPDANISLKWEEGGGDFAPKYQNGNVYFYNGNRVTVAGTANDVTIKKIVFTFSSGSVSMVTCNASGKNESSYGITNSSANMTSTWEGETNSLIFRAPKQTGVRYISSIAVTYTGGTTGPVVTAPKLNIETTNWNDTYDMDEAKVFVVYAKNEGNAAAENAKVTVYVDDAVNTTWEIGTLAIGAENVWKNMKYNLEGLEAGNHQVKLALTADNADAFEVEKEVTFTKAAAEATFSIAANNVTVPYDATTFTVVAQLTNTSEIAGENVKVELRDGITTVAATQTVETLAASASTEVRLTVEGGPFDAGQKTYYLYVNDKYLSPVEVTFEAAPVEDVYDLAIYSISGTIEQANETSTVRVIVLNNGNVDIADAAVTLKAGETVLGTATVSATAGQAGWADFAVPTAGFEPGEVDFTATVTVEGDATPADNTMTQKLTVVAAPAPEATFTVTAENVTVPYDATTFTVVAQLTNTSEIAGENVKVELRDGVTTVAATQTVETLAASASTEVRLTVEGGPFDAGQKTYYLYVNDKYLNPVEVTFEDQPVEQVVDINLTAIQGVTEINLKETNIVQVLFDNNSTVDELNATITLSLNGAEVETKAITKNLSFLSFTLPTDDLTAGEEATIVATLNAENNKEGNTASLEKKLNVVSGEAAPAAEISINPISGWNVEAGEQTVNVGVTLFNNGEVDAENVTVEVFKSYGDGLCEAQTVSVPAGENNYKMLTFTFTYTFEAGKSYEFTAYTSFADANGENNMQKFTLTCPAPVADVAIAKIADVVATPEEEVQIIAKVQNLSDIAAENVLVALYQGMEQVGTTKTINEIEALGEAQVNFNLGQLAAGNYYYTVQIVSTDANATNNIQDVTVTVAEPMVETIEVALTAIQGISNIDLAEGANNTISVWAENTGNVDAEALITVTLNGNAVGEAQTITVKAGKNGSASFTLPTEGLVAGEKATVVATITVEGNTAEATTLTREYDIVNSSEATEPVFAITTEPVEVEFGAEKFNVTATVKNISEIAATNVEVSLFYNGVIATQTIEALAAGAETTVTFTDVENPFTKAGEYTMYVQAPKALAEVIITVKPEVVAPVYDLAITEVIGTIEKANETGNVRVSVQNNGNQDITDAAVTLKAGETVLGTATVSAKAGQTGFCTIAVATEGLTAGELQVTATVEVENDATPDDNTMTATLTVNDVPAAEPVLELSADDIEITKGEAFELSVPVKVKNTSAVDAENVTLNLIYNGFMTIATKTIEKVAAGEETTVTFTIDDVAEAYKAMVPTILANLPVGETTLYVKTADSKFMTSFKLIVKEPVGPEVVDLAIANISGSLSIDLETNYVTVFVDNLGTVDVTGATVTLKAGEKVLGTGTVSAKAGETNKFCSIAVAGADLTVGEFTVTATVEVEGDANLTNNTLEKTYTIAAPAAVLSFTVADVTAIVNATSFDVKVNVKNTGKGDAENVAVKVYDEESELLAETTIASIAAGAEETATVTVNKTYTEVGTYKNQLQVWVAGVDGVKWVDVTVNETGVGIAALKAQYGENVQIFTVNGQKVNEIRKGGLYIINGKKTVIK